MKKIISILCFSGLVLFSGSCNKSKQNNREASTSIVGNWELRKTSAAMMQGVVNHPVGNGTILKFTGTTYERYANGQLVKSGQYAIIPDATVEKSVCLVYAKNQFANRIEYDGNSDEKVFFQVANNKLTFVSGCYALNAGHSSVYERLAN